MAKGAVMALQHKWICAVFQLWLIHKSESKTSGKVPQTRLLFTHVYAAEYRCVIRYNIVSLLLQSNATAAGTLMN